MEKLIDKYPILSAAIIFAIIMLALYALKKVFGCNSCKANTDKSSDGTKMAMGGTVSTHPRHIQNYQITKKPVWNYQQMIGTKGLQTPEGERLLTSTTKVPSSFHVGQKVGITMITQYNEKYEVVGNIKEIKPSGLEVVVENLGMNAMVNVHGIMVDSSQMIKAKTSAKLYQLQNGSFSSPSHPLTMEHGSPHIFIATAISPLETYYETQYGWAKKSDVDIV